MAKRTISESVEGESRLNEVLSLVETLTTEELGKVVEKVRALQKERPILLPEFPKELRHLQGKFTIFDKGSAGDSHDFDDISPDSVHSYKLVWINGDEMDLKIANQEGVMYAGTTKFEVQGVRVGPLLLTASFPAEPRLPASTAEDFDESLPQFIDECKDHGVEFETYELLSCFINWLMDEVVEGPTHYVWYVVNDGALAEAYKYYSDPEADV